LVAINPPMPINDLHIYPGTGLVFLANETSPMTGYYVPQLGPAPKWCRFLDNMTEEMEDDQETLVYDDYKFVDRQELDELNLGHLIGTDTLKPYMHGFFVDLRLYTKARAIANPFQYAEHRDKLIRDKLAAEQESRIRGAKKVTGSSSVPGVKVNKSLAKKLRAEEEAARKREAGEVDDEEDGDGRRKRKKKQQAVDGPNLLQDNRFADIFTNPDFEIDEESREFMLLNPSGGPVSTDLSPCLHRSITDADALALSSCSDTTFPRRTRTSPGPMKTTTQQQASIRAIATKTTRKAGPRRTVTKQATTTSRESHELCPRQHLLDHSLRRPRRAQHLRLQSKAVDHDPRLLQRTTRTTRRSRMLAHGRLRWKTVRSRLLLSELGRSPVVAATARPASAPRSTRQTKTAATRLSAVLREEVWRCRSSRRRNPKTKRLRSAKCRRRSGTRRRRTRRALVWVSSGRAAERPTKRQSASSKATRVAAEPRCGNLCAALRATRRASCRVSLAAAPAAIRPLRALWLGWLVRAIL
jgi:hypothetical protein